MIFVNNPIKMNSINTFFLLLALTTFFLGCSDESASNDVPTEQVANDAAENTDVVMVDHVDPETVKKNQEAKNKPYDPFETNLEFENMIAASANTVVFNFAFEHQDEVLTLPITNETVNFELKGSVKTSVDLENKGALTLQVYNTDQVSFANRKILHSFDLPFVQRVKKKTNRDKSLYSFDFKKTFKVTPGLHYFLIIPDGRNRILYAGKFIAR